jgi:Lytic polysaccharide mono-oxygenase, cellulose-degrading
VTGLQRPWTRWCLSGAALGATLSLAAAAQAHIDLATPTPRAHGPSRDPASNIKKGPCGQEVNGRTSSVSVFAPGETIEVTWSETTNHRSYYRVAFDRDGDDAFPTFEGPGTGAMGIDPSGPCPVDGQVILAYDMDDRNGGSHTLSVRLPDVECESCTLQVVQFMYDTGKPYYFQCADLALRRPRANGPDGGAVRPARVDGGLNAALPDAGGVNDVSAAAGCWSRIAPPAAVAAAPEGDATPATPPSIERPPEAPAITPDPPAAAVASRGSDGGCALAPARESSHAPTLMSIGVAFSLLLVGARRASRSPRRS